MTQMRQINSLNFYLVLLGIFVVMLGAFTRLTNSGLGCPDWPGCYGQLLVPGHVPVAGFDAAKAWAEMIHRYAAGIYASGIFMWAGLRLRLNRFDPYPYLLMTLGIYHAAFVAWSVTWKLHPLAVMPHLMGGMVITSLLWYIYLGKSNKNNASTTTTVLWSIAFLSIIAQCIIGGWTSANYAALICPDFPTCQGGWPAINWGHTTNLQLPLGQNHDGGLLSIPERISIHMLHRYLGFLTGITVVSLVSWSLFHHRSRQSFRATIILVGTFCCQATLGALNILWALPLSIATLHNGIALMVIFAMIYYIKQVKRYA